MKIVGKIWRNSIIFLSVNFPMLLLWCSKVIHVQVKLWIGIAIGLFLGVMYLIILACPQMKKFPNKMLKALSNGCEVLRMFLYSFIATMIFQIYMVIVVMQRLLPWNGIQLSDAVLLFQWLFCLAIAVILETVVFWSGMVRIYASSVQLGVKRRILAIIFAWIPIFNIFYLLNMIHVSEEEVKIETEKLELDETRKKTEICKTKYPILMVHGVFFRDFRYFNYWGRIPDELIRNGAHIFYGEQQSAASVEECGKVIAERISKIVEETGCEKVNIIAHSKGGLDCRAAISHYGAAAQVASLTTINTPHHGCIFAEYLLEKIPEKVRNKVANTYNRTLKKFGERDADFMAAVTDLTQSACEKRNEITIDAEGILYESVMSYCKKAQSGRFPLNLSYPLVKHFDGKNDGLVSENSARWGTHFTLIEPKSRRGISHGDMIDLNRENFKGFDVREFYVKLVAELKNRGY